MSARKIKEEPYDPEYTNKCSELINNIKIEKFGEELAQLLEGEFFEEEKVKTTSNNHNELGLEKVGIEKNSDEENDEFDNEISEGFFEKFLESAKINEALCEVKNDIFDYEYEQEEDVSEEQDTSEGVASEEDASEKTDELKENTQKEKDTQDHEKRESTFVMKSNDKKEFSDSNLIYSYNENIKRKTSSLDKTRVNNRKPKNNEHSKIKEKQGYYHSPSPKRKKLSLSDKDNVCETDEEPSKISSDNEFYESYGKQQNLVDANEQNKCIEESPIEKLKKAIKICSQTIENLRLYENKKQSSKFILAYTAVQQKDKSKIENCSPLKLINNVKFKFNSSTNKIDNEVFGIVSLPEVSSTIASIIGFDGEVIIDKLNSKNLPYCLEMLKKANDDEVEIIDNTTKCYISIGIQTNIPCKNCNKKTVDVEVQTDFHIEQQQIYPPQNYQHQQYPLAYQYSNYNSSVPHSSASHRRSYSYYQNYQNINRDPVHHQKNYFQQHYPQQQQHSRPQYPRGK